MKTALRCFFLMAIAVLCHKQVDGREIEIDLEKMVKSAGTIFSGRCIDVQNGVHPDYQNVNVKFVEFDILDVLEGRVGDRLKFMQFGNGIEMPHAPKYRKGENVLLFLYPASQYGFTSPVGGHQGKFSIKTDAESGKPAVVEVLNKRKLFEIRESENRHDNVKITENGSGSIDYGLFKEMISKIIDKKNDMEETK